MSVFTHVVRAGVGAALALATLLPGVADADTLTVRDVEFESGVVKITIPQIDVIDGDASEADIRGLFAADGFLPSMKRLSEIQARSISVPALTLRQKVPAVNGTQMAVDMVFSGFEMKDLAGGVARQVVVGDLAYLVKAREDVRIALGRLSAEDFGVRNLFEMYSGEAAVGHKNLMLIYRNLAMTGGPVVAPGLSNCAIGAIRAREFSARPLTIAMAELQTLSDRAKVRQGFDPVVIGKLVLLYDWIFNGVVSAPMEFDGFRCTVRAPKQETVSIGLGKAMIGAFGNGRYPSFGLNDLELTSSENVAVKIKSLLFKGMNFKHVMEAVVPIREQLTPEWFAGNYRKLIPHFDGLKVEGVSFVVPDKEKSLETISGALELFDLTLGGYRAGIPSDVAIDTRHLAFDLPKASQDAQIKQLLKAGLTRLDVGFRGFLKWDEASSTIRIADLSVEGEQMGAARITGTIGNAEADLFDEDPLTMQIAAMALTAKELSVKLDDRGLINIAVQQQAAGQGGDVKATRKKFGEMAAMLVAGTLGGTAEAKKVAQAIAGFVSTGKPLALTATASEPDGIDVMSLLLASRDPKQLLDKVKITTP